MRTTVRKIGNSRGILIPAALLAECGVVDEIDMRLEGKTIVIIIPSFAERYLSTSLFEGL